MDSGHALTPHQISLLRRWIEEGREVGHALGLCGAGRGRSCRPLTTSTWARNPIDRFVLARLEREGLTPSEEADRITLLRRVTYDLTGLPPTPAEVDAFLADRSPDAYEKRVDALLQSPRYGERMAMPWLDAARYADTHGYHIDSLRGMWPWRDWVIDAFNRNLSYDQFVIEQLAGDLLPNATRAQKVASGFNRNHMINFEGGAIAEEYQVEYVVDRVEATSSAFMGLTMGCARCHSHKFDPISHKEFYQFYAFFNNVPERGLDGRTGNAAPFLPLPTPEQQTADRRSGRGDRTRDRALADADRRAAPARVGEDARPCHRDGGRDRRADGALRARRQLLGSVRTLSARPDDRRRSDVRDRPDRTRRCRSTATPRSASATSAASIARDTFSLAVWLRGRGNLPMAVFQKLDDGQRRRGYEWRFDDVTLVGIQRWAARLTIAVTSEAPGDGRFGFGRANGSGSATGITCADLRRIRQGLRPAPLRRRQAVRHRGRAGFARRPDGDRRAAPGRQQGARRAVRRRARRSCGCTAASCRRSDPPVGGRRRAPRDRLGRDRQADARPRPPRSASTS